jgi:hypothetical protein
MPSIDNWLADGGQFDASPDRIIERGAVSVVLRRNTGGTPSTISAQTVRLVPARPGTTAAEKRGQEGTQTGETLIVMIGTESLDVKRDDRFTYLATVYAVVSVDRTMAGKTEALCRGVQ